MYKYHITIIGAGIIGLTTACTLLKEYSLKPNLELILISETFSPETTGDISADYCEPYGLESIDERILHWAGYTYDIFINEFLSTKVARAGIMKMPAHTLHGFNDKYEIGIFCHLKPTSGFVMTPITVEVRYYLKELRRFLAQDSRVKFIKKKIHSFNELANQTIRLARGQIIRIHAPWIKSVYNFGTDEDEAYIIPQSNSVVLGGTFQLNDWNTSIVESHTKKILRMYAKCLPALEQIHHGKVQVGLRPYRDNGVRVEHEKTTDGIDIVNCSGHSGSGIALSCKSCCRYHQNTLAVRCKTTRRSKG